MGPLRNPRHEIFAQELAAGKAELEAYRIAGFAKPRQCNANRLRHTDHVRERVREIACRHAELAGAHSGAVQLELARLGFANMLDYVQIGDNGLPYVDLTGLTREKGAAIAEFTVDTIPGKDDAPTVTRVKFKLHDKRGALSDLAKIVGAVKDPLADALTGVADRLDRAIQRATAA